MVEEILELVVESRPWKFVDYNHPFGVGAKEIIEGREKMVLWCTFKGRENIINAYGWWHEMLEYNGYEALAFRIIEGRLCEICDGIAKEGLLQDMYEVKDSVLVN